MKHIQSDVPRCNLAVRGNVCAPCRTAAVQMKDVCHVNVNPEPNLIGCFDGSADVE